MLVNDGIEGFSMNKLARACSLSVATLYIYYKDKEDLITSIAIEEGEKMHEETMKNFDPEMHFAEGLKRQWENRSRYVMENPEATQLFEQLRTSTYHPKVLETFHSNFKEMMSRFVSNAVQRGELDLMPLEVYWSVAFSPLYALLRFHNEGTSIGGKPFTISEKVLWGTFDLVLKALLKNKEFYHEHRS
jgi:AcrR family transcriptional regulator